MTGFSKKANAQQSNNSHTGDASGGGNNSGNNASQKEFNDWAFQQYDSFKAKAKKLSNGKLRKEKVLIGKVGFIMDLGTPPSAPSEWTTKCALPVEGEEFSQEELAWIKENPTHSFIWTKDWDASANGGKGGMKDVRKQTSPSYPQQEYGVCIDFPSIMVDYSKVPNSTSTEEDLRPYRISLNGVFNKTIQRNIPFDGSFKPVSDKNILYKVCAAAGLEQALINSEFDIATLADATCNFTVRMDITDTTGKEQSEIDEMKVYLNDSVSKPAQIDDLEMPDDSIFTADAQIAKVMNKDGIAPFTGILLDGMDYTETMFNMIGSDKFGFLKRAQTSKEYTISGISKKNNEPYSFEKGIEYANTDFAKAYAAYKGEDAPQSSQQPSQESKVEAKQTPKVVEKVAEKAVPQAPEVDEEDFTDVPF